VSFHQWVTHRKCRNMWTESRLWFEGLMLVNITTLSFLDVGDGNWNLLFVVFYSYSTCLRSVSCLDVSTTSEIGRGISEDSLSLQLDVSCIKLLKADIFSAEYCVSLNWYLACYMSSLAICHPYIASMCYGLGVTALVRRADIYSQEQLWPWARWQ
jgi:hypothetical protein